MKILIEGEKYNIELLEQYFDTNKFYVQNESVGVITSVGYYYNSSSKEIIYMLPKVFMKDSENTVFGINKDELILFEIKNIKHKKEYNWIRRICVYFYNSLLEFKRRNIYTSLLGTSLSKELNTNLGSEEYSYLDLILSFVNFYKKNKNVILFNHIQYKSKQVRKTNWEKTIRKSTPLFVDNQPIYEIYRNKKRVVNTEEQLLIYYFSILNRFNEEHHLGLKIDTSYQIIKGDKFDNLQQNGLQKLKKIKYRYFNDILRRMYHLCEIYFKKNNQSSMKKNREEFISISNYNIVFEDMIDKLFSDTLKDDLQKLKQNDDGKIMDHIFDYQSLLDTSDIFYIGDSKYYKSYKTAGKISKYKQFTYAKNIIQYNINLLNKEDCYKENIRYRDELTEGYNITPNFFIYGYIKNYRDLENPHLELKEKPEKSFHFKDRLFDRDTLFIQQYKMNFLYVLMTYSNFNNQSIENFRDKTKTEFRNNFLAFFADESKCGFSFYKYKKTNFKDFVDNNFKFLNGKVFCTNNNELILAKHTDDNILPPKLLNDFEEYIL